jgi:hypothetical protein
MAYTIEAFGDEFTNVTGIKATDDNDNVVAFIKPVGTKSISTNGTGIDVAEYASVDVNVPSGQPNLQTKTYTVNSAGTATVTADNGYDGLSSVAVNVPSADIEPWLDYGYTTRDGVYKFNFETGYLVRNDGDGWVSSSDISDVLFNAIQSNTTVTPTESAQTIGGANYMMNGAITVNAIPSNYVGSGITQRSSSDLTVSGATVTVPSGYYSEQASKAVASGTAGTPTATKGTVSNHSVSVTPSVTNTSGYITGSTKTGTAVSVSASELVSGTLPISDNGTSDCTNYASVNVNIPFVTYYTGTSDPASSLGSNGDIYLKVVS